MASLGSLPVEILLKIFRGMSLQDILNMSQTCKWLRELTENLPDPWLNAYDAHFITPPTGKTVDSIPTPLLPKYAARAASLLKVWNSENTATPKRWRKNSIPNLADKFREWESPFFYQALDIDYNVGSHSRLDFLYVIPGSKWTVAKLDNKVCLYNPDTDGSAEEDAFLPLFETTNPLVCTSWKADSDEIIWLVLIESTLDLGAAVRPHQGFIYELRFQPGDNDYWFPEREVIQTLELPFPVRAADIRDELLVCSHQKEQALLIINWKAGTGLVLERHNPDGVQNQLWQNISYLLHPRIHPRSPMIFYGAMHGHDIHLETVDIPHILPPISNQWTREVLHPGDVFPSIPRPVYWEFHNSPFSTSQFLTIVSARPEVYPQTTQFSSRILEIRNDQTCAHMFEPGGLWREIDHTPSTVEHLNGRTIFAARDFSQFSCVWFRPEDGDFTFQSIRADFPPEITALKPRNLFFNPHSGKVFGKCDEGLFIVQY
ncbi:hypothetical protein SISSUDRAFT_1129267 [Sistotremastrum suecicum HHB10207 ss-3]|uniref:F-box domain-containing protein n=1 Tax=Sistotremastrum suecicum HHB10207 ss-3 TaxID=1314776 RepID=A0A166CWK9_9AGAM|nr:hypothetical protein SISSUDRAFT_1129267 [Sistotremastrum suecicum HHB10207 ss-3]